MRPHLLYGEAHHFTTKKQVVRKEYKTRHSSPTLRSVARLRCKYLFYKLTGFLDGITYRNKIKEHKGLWWQKIYRQFIFKILNPHRYIIYINPTSGILFNNSLQSTDITGVNKFSLFYSSRNNTYLPKIRTKTMI